MASSFIPPQGFGVPSLAATPTAGYVNPGDSANSYVNQQLGALMSKTGSSVGPSQPRATLPTTAAARQLSGVQQSSADAITKVQESNARLKAIGAPKKPQVAAGGGGVATGPGVAWQPNGSLSASRNRALALASTYIGKTPYVWGGKSAKGTDCAGLVMMVYNQLGFNLGGYNGTRKLSTIPGVRTNLANLRPGDIVAWKNGSHVAIYAGNGQIIEAAKPGTNVRRVNLWANPNAVYGIQLRLPGE